MVKKLEKTATKQGVAKRSKSVPAKSLAPKKSKSRTAGAAVEIDTLKRGSGLDEMTLRAATLKKPPTVLRKVGGGWMICYLQDDGSYAECQPYDSSDGLFRSAVANNVSALAGREKLYERTEVDLFALLAGMAADPTKAITGADSASRRAVDADDFRRGSDDFYRSDDFRRSKAATELGRRIFSRWSRAFHDFVCSPDAADKDLKEQMLKAIFSKSGGGVAVVAGGLVAAFGLSPAIAAVVAALLIKLIVAPAIDEVCKAWGAQISGVAVK